MSIVCTICLGKYHPVKSAKAHFQTMKHRESVNYWEKRRELELLESKAIVPVPVNQFDVQDVSQFVVGNQEVQNVGNQDKFLKPF